MKNENSKYNNEYIDTHKEDFITVKHYSDNNSEKNIVNDDIGILHPYINSSQFASAIGYGIQNNCFVNITNDRSGVTFIYRPKILNEASEDIFNILSIFMNVYVKMLRYKKVKCAYIKEEKAIVYAVSAVDLHQFIKENTLKRYITALNSSIEGFYEV